MSAPPTGSSEKESSARRTNFLLGLGAVAGLIAAALGLLLPDSSSNDPPEQEIVAIVNGDVILRDDYLRLLAGFERDARNPVDDKIRQHVLDRMIEEELLVQRALDLGLVTPRQALVPVSLVVFSTNRHNRSRALADRLFIFGLH